MFTAAEWIVALLTLAVAIGVYSIYRGLQRQIEILSMVMQKHLGDPDLHRTHDALLVTEAHRQLILDAITHLTDFNRAEHNQISIRIAGIEFQLRRFTGVNQQQG